MKIYKLMRRMNRVPPLFLFIFPQTLYSFLCCFSNLLNNFIRFEINFFLLLLKFLTFEVITLSNMLNMTLINYFKINSLFVKMNATEQLQFSFFFLQVVLFKVFGKSLSFCCVIIIYLLFNFMQVVLNKLLSILHKFISFLS